MIIVRFGNKAIFGNLEKISFREVWGIKPNYKEKE